MDESAGRIVIRLNPAEVLVLEMASKVLSGIDWREIHRVEYAQGKEVTIEIRGTTVVEPEDHPRGFPTGSRGTRSPSC